MDDKFVDIVVRQVLEALKAPGKAATPAKPAPAAPLSAPAGRPPAPKAAPARVFVTAETLIQRLAGGASVELAHNEVLTPNALDYTLLKRITVTRQAAPSPIAPAEVAPPATPAAALSAVPAGSDRVGLIVERADVKVSSLLAGLAREKINLADYTQTPCWMQNLRVVGQEIVSGRLCAGVVVLPYGADAMALAGKMPGVRPVQGTRVESVRSAVEHYHANLLVVEHAFSTLHEMRQMIRLFAQRPVQAARAQTLVEHLAELERA